MSCLCRRGRIDINAAHPALLERDGLTRADEASRQLAEARLVPHERHALALGEPGQIPKDVPGAPAWRQRLQHDEGGRYLEARSHDVGGLTGAQERARCDRVKRNTKTGQAAHALGQPGHADAAQWTFRVVGPRAAALFRNAVADQVQLDQRAVLFALTFSGLSSAPRPARRVHNSASPSRPRM